MIGKLKWEWSFILNLRVMIRGSFGVPKTNRVSKAHRLKLFKELGRQDSISINQPLQKNYCGVAFYFIRIRIRIRSTNATRIRNSRLLHRTCVNTQKQTGTVTLIRVHNKTQTRHRTSHSNWTHTIFIYRKRHKGMNMPGLWMTCIFADEKQIKEGGRLKGGMEFTLESIWVTV